MSDTTARERAEAAMKQAHDQLEQRVAERTDELQQAIDMLRAEISGHERTEEALRASEEEYRLLVENSHDIIATINLDGVLTFVSPSWTVLLGHAIEQVVGKHMGAFIHQDDLARCQAVMETVVTTGQRKSGIEYRVQHADASWRWHSSNGGPVRDRAGTVIGYQAIASDVTERKQAEAEIARALSVLTSTMESTADGILVTDGGGGIIRSNSQFRQMWRIPEAIAASGDDDAALGFVLDQLKDPEVFLDTVRGLYDAPEKTSFDVLEFKDGRVVERYSQPQRIHDGVVGRVWSFRDVTERKRAEAEKDRLEHLTRHLQKSESLGRMAGAIAHHFNNQLQVVTGNLELALGNLSEGADAIESLHDALRATRGASEVSALMLTYLGLAVTTREPMDLADVCRRNLLMLEVAMPKNLVLEVEVPTHGPTVRANANQIQQVLANLVTNAWEAAGTAPGTIRVTVNTVAVTDIPMAHRFPVDWRMPDDACAYVEVTDTGCGMTDGDIERIFDPFFSSKFAGRGMGLAAVLGIVRAHEGAITVESTPGSGSIFRVYIPLTRAAIPRSPTHVAAAPNTPAGGTVLVVEDEAMVRTLAVAMLTRMGFTVLAAKDGVEAVEVFRLHADNIGCVLCDLTMPRMNGWETLTALRQIAPGIPVVLASGYSEATVMEGTHGERPQAFLSKPYGREDLRAAIRLVTGAETLT